jgi:hypothetical protein
VEGPHLFYFAVCLKIEQEFISEFLAASRATIYDCIDRRRFTSGMLTKINTFGARFLLPYHVPSTEFMQ